MEMIAYDGEGIEIYRKQVSSVDEAQEQLEKGEPGWFAVVLIFGGATWVGVREVGVTGMQLTESGEWEFT